MNFANFFDEPNGFPLESDATLGFMQSDYQAAILGMVEAFAGQGVSGVIISGMVDSGGSVSDGWIFYNNDFIHFEGGTIDTSFYIDEVYTQKANQSGTLIDRYTQRTARFGSGSGSAPYSSLIRLESLFAIQQKVIDGLALETSVLLSGCAVTSVNTGTSTLNISAGSAIINRKFVTAAAYSGGYPVYLNEVGQWVNTPPANYIKFDPYTSQRIQHVYHRQGAPAGSIQMIAALTDRFDGTGLGKWEWLGWAVCNGANGTIDLRSRFPLQYDPRTSDPGGNIWDANYNTPGNTGGEKKHVLTIAELPIHNHTGGTGAVAAGSSGLARRSISGENVTASTYDTINSGTEMDVLASPTHIPMQGNDTPHENRPPYKVLVFIQRI